MKELKVEKIRKDIDVIQVEFTTFGGKQKFYLTPDEALQVAQILNTTVAVWRERQRIKPFIRQLLDKQN